MLKNYLLNWRILLIIKNFCLDLFLALFAVFVAWMAVRVFIIASFRIPTQSMLPTLWEGDYVLVNKLVYGPRLFDLSAAMRGRRVEVYRLPGFRPIRRGDVVVFHEPYPRMEEKMEMHLLRYLVKRSVGIPGDSLLIRNGFYKVVGLTDTVGYLPAQKSWSRVPLKVSNRRDYRCFPFDTIVDWTVKGLGPLYIPKVGDEITLTRKHIALYRFLIEWELGEQLTLCDTSLYIGNRRLDRYRFKKNYYFMAGDNVEGSRDSRFFGLIPEDFIVGKVCRVWKSIIVGTDKWRWDRFMKKID